MPFTKFERPKRGPGAAGPPGAPGPSGKSSVMPVTSRRSSAVPVVSCGLHAVDVALGGRGFSERQVMAVVEHGAAAGGGGNTSSSSSSTSSSHLRRHRYRTPGAVLARYFAAQGLAEADELLWVDATRSHAAQHVDLVPVSVSAIIQREVQIKLDREEREGTLERHAAAADVAQKSAKQGAKGSSTSASSSASSSSKGLNNAWQYEKYMARSGSSSAAGGGVDPTVEVHQSSDSLVGRTVQRHAKTFDLSITRGSTSASSSSATTTSATATTSTSSDTSQISLVGVLDECNGSWVEVLAKIRQHLGRAPSADNPTELPFLRIVISGLGDEHWIPSLCDDASSPAAETALSKFLVQLRAELSSSQRSASAVFVLPATAVQSPTKATLLASLYSDAAVSFVSFDEQLQGVVSEAYASYHGEMRVLKQPLFGRGRAGAALDQTKSYVFAEGRRKLHVKVIDLGPSDGGGPPAEPGAGKASKRDAPKSLHELAHDF